MFDQRRSVHYRSRAKPLMARVLGFSRSAAGALCRLLLVPAALGGCAREVVVPPLAEQPSGAGNVDTQSAVENRATPYPPGKWRLVAPEEVAQVKLWLSHIVIRYDQVETRDVSFHLNGWRSAARPTLRTRPEALALAEHVVSLARNGGEFGALARKFSDEPETATLGGSLGGLSAGQLIPWPGVLDAVETLKPGDVSNAVETETGYHIFHRRPPPPQATVSGRHIVIAHDDAPWIELAARGEVPRRSRQDALALAAGLYERARKGPDEFERLVAEYSEHRDAARGGDFGTWATWEVNEYPREVEALENLAVGEVAEPIDSLFGVQIIMRVENPPRQRYAMTAIQFRFDPQRPPADPLSKHTASQKAEGVSLSLREDPERFAMFQQQICCSSVVEVIAGRNLPALEDALAALAPGEIAARPIEDRNLEYIIPKRLPLDTLPPAPATRFELPSSLPLR